MIIKWKNYLVKVRGVEAHGQEMIRFSDCQAYDKNDRSTYFPYILLRPGEFEVLSASKGELKALQRLKEKLKPIKISVKEATAKRSQQHTWIVKLQPTRLHLLNHDLMSPSFSIWKHYLGDYLIRWSRRNAFENPFL